MNPIFLKSVDHNSCVHLVCQSVTVRSRLPSVLRSGSSCRYNFTSLFHESVYFACVNLYCVIIYCCCFVYSYSNIPVSYTSNMTIDITLVQDFVLYVVHFCLCACKGCCTLCSFHIPTCYLSYIYLLPYSNLIVQNISYDLFSCNKV